MQAEMSAFLKAHFRTVSCVQPDYELICSVSLFSDGFSTAKVNYSIDLLNTNELLRMKMHCRKGEHKSAKQTKQFYCEK